MMNVNLLFLVLPTMLAAACLANHAAAEPIELSAAHVEAVQRYRRIVVNFDVIHGDASFTTRPIPDLIAHRFTYADDPDVHIDSIWWNWGEGNQTPYPSKHLPLYKHAGYQRWIDEGIDIVQIFVDETRKRGIEVFLTHRMNGSDNDLGPFEYDNLPAKKDNPHLLMQMSWGAKVWNFAHEEVHDYVLRNLREVAENYDFDGIDLDFARGCVFKPGEGWVNRHQLTSFARRLRTMLLEIEQKRGRPFLLSARVPESLIGCHFDGIDAETWTRDNLIDIYAIGVRSLQADVLDFRAMIGDRPQRVYVSLDDHHSTDGYMWPPMEVFRGAFANWYHQGADGVQAFNFAYAGRPLHKQAFAEMADPDGLRLLDKHFVLTRRGGGHGPTVIPNPEDWSTPRQWFGNSSMLALLPATLEPAGKADTLLTMYIGDDFGAEAENIKQLSLHVLLNDPATADLPEDQKWPQALIRHFRGVDFLRNSPPRKGAELRAEVRVNNILLTNAAVEGGWLVYRDLDPRIFAVGDNLIGILLPGRDPADTVPVLIEKLEVRVSYDFNKFGADRPYEKALIAYWPFDNDLDDATGNRHDTYSQGPVERVEGRSGHVLKVEGGFLEIANPTTIIGPAGTVAFDFNVANPAGEHAVLTKGGGQSNNLMFAVRDGKLQLAVSPNHTDLRPTTVEGGRWYHVVWTCDESTYRLWVDGSDVPIADRPAIGPEGGWWDRVPPPPDPNPIRIGSVFHNGGTTARFHGRIDDVAIWDRVLSDDEIATLAEQGVAAVSGLAR